MYVYFLAPKTPEMICRVPQELIIVSLLCNIRLDFSNKAAHWASQIKKMTLHLMRIHKLLSDHETTLHNFKAYVLVLIAF